MTSATPFLPPPPDLLVELGPMAIAAVYVLAAKVLGDGGHLSIDALIVIAYAIGVWAERKRTVAQR